MDKRFPVVCEGCQKEPCPYEGNEFAFARVGRVGHCPFNPKVEEKEAAKKSQGWKRSRNK